MDVLSDYRNMDIMFGNSNTIGREFDNILNAQEKHKDLESLPNRRGSSQHNEIRNIDRRNCPLMQYGFAKTFEKLSCELNARLSQKWIH